MKSPKISVRQMHPFHLVDGSPWPIQMAQSIQGLAVGIVNQQVSKTGYQAIPSLLAIVIIGIQWWRDVIREAKAGYHTTVVQQGIQIGFLLFLVSEVMLFVSFFWAFFHSSLAPAVEQGSIWPPVGINAVNPWAIPLQGSCVLLGSGFVLTLSHHATIAGNKSQAQISLFFTIVQGALFVFLQYNEYSFGEFCISDAVYGSVFYITTGTHALHVIIGVIFLAVSYIRLYQDNFTTEHHLGFEFSIFYYHQVDVVWLFVFVTYYWWGS